MVDVLSHGRLELGTGKGITPFEHLQFGHDPDEAAERAKEILTMLLRAWETGIMSVRARKYYDFLELKLPFELKQKPYPPLWTAGNVVAAGNGGHNFVFPYTMTEEIRAKYDELRAASRQQPGHQNPHVTEPRIAQCQGVLDRGHRRRGRGHRPRGLGRLPGVADARPRADPAAPPGGRFPTSLTQPGGQGSADARPGRDGAARLRHGRDGQELLRRAGPPGACELLHRHAPVREDDRTGAEYTLEAFISEIIPAVREVEASTVGV